ncbi:hypothetical protein [Rugosibacter aromaticivorans]|nr:hypothetical protein [Rugosibacter aromaticivorans]
MEHIPQDKRAPEFRTEAALNGESHAVSKSLEASDEKSALASRRP